MGKIIWIEGLVGIGKSTFAEVLAKHTDAVFLREPVDDNPYLADFYQDMTRWGFSMQMELLYRRFDQHWYAMKNDGVYVFDRGITGDKVFADLLHDSGNITDREYQTYVDTHTIMVDKLTPPDIIIYLDGSPERAHRRILSRNRSQEEGLPLKYLEDMNEYYQRLFLSNRRDRFIMDSEIRVYDWKEDYQDPRYYAPIVGSLAKFFRSGTE